MLVWDLPPQKSPPLELSDHQNPTMSQRQTGTSKDGPVPLRRSSRLGTPSAAASRIESVATNAQTPSRVRGPKKGALPSIKARESHAYGASGRVGAPDQLVASTAGFAETFEAQRKQAVARDTSHDEDEHASESIDDIIDELAAGTAKAPARSTARSQASTNIRGQSKQTSAQTQDSREAVPARTNAAASARANAPSGLSRTFIPDRTRSPSPVPSELDTSKSFGMQREAGMTFTHTYMNGAASSSIHHPSSPTRSASHAAQLRDRFSRPQRPSYLNVPTMQPPPIPRRMTGFALPNVTRSDDDEETETYRASLSEFFWGALQAVCIMALLGLSIWTFTHPATHDFFGRATDTLLHRGSKISASPVSPPPATTSEPITDRQGRKVHEPGYVPWPHRLRNLEDTADALDIAFDRISKNAKAMDATLDDLKSKLPDHVLVTMHESNRVEIHDEFWRALEGRLRAEGFIGLDNTDDKGWDAFLAKNRDKIHRFWDERLRSPDIESKFRVIARDEFVLLLQEHYRAMQDTIDEKVERAVTAASKTIASDIAKKAFHDQIRLESLATANLLKNLELRYRKVNYFSLGLGARVDPYLTSSTYSAPQPWANRIYNALLTPPRAAPPVAALEKWDEPGDCWCAAPSDTGNGLAQLTVLLGHRMLPRQVTIEHIPKEASLDWSVAPKNMELWAESDDEKAGIEGCSVHGPEGFICLGKFAYNVHAGNHVQTFELDAIVKRPVGRVMARVTENWGGDHTCLYRLRLHGEKAPDDEE